MTQYPYIELENSNASLSKRFRVVRDGLKDTSRKTANVEYAIGGEPDIGMGAVHEHHEYVVRVPHSETDSDFGDLSELKQFYALNNPNGTPSNLITFTDHLGSSAYVYMVGDFGKSLLGVEVFGTHAHYIVQIQLHEQ